MYGLQDRVMLGLFVSSSILCLVCCVIRVVVFHHSPSTFLVLV